MYSSNMEKILGINVKYDELVLSSQNILENSNLFLTALITHNILQYILLSVNEIYLLK